MGRPEEDSEATAALARLVDNSGFPYLSQHQSTVCPFLPQKSHNWLLPFPFPLSVHGKVQPQQIAQDPH